MLQSDPLDLLLGPDHDIVIDEEGLHFVSGLEGIAQLCKIAILLFLEEWFLNLGVGVPWYQELLGEKFDAGLVRSKLVEVLIRVPGVIEVIAVLPKINPETRRVTVTWSVRTAFGDTEPDTLVPGGTSG